ncbi:hypothetical protein BUALT_Bualt17G0071100 [Buddleja alternifolia]|uniref:RING-type E3 ubiquitin transferase n=1 Tax=Buddleja alternifolia TaxID=168488 RepID=A0AAV6W8D7_9LAMI|nr:hypothetical protein BUALT_Bualt17G0071100 [Buddleja alternifolia]
MASSDPSFIENLINSRNRDISLFFPFIFGLNPSNQSENHESPDRIVLINPFTQGMVVIERSEGGGGDSGSGERFASFFDDLFSRKGGHPPASRASIEAMECVEIGEGEDDDDRQCVICLDEWGIGEKVKEMPCKHSFHEVYGEAILVGSPLMDENFKIH